MRSLAFAVSAACLALMSGALPAASRAGLPLDFAGGRQTRLAQSPCTPVGEARFICGLPSPEDLVEVPDSTWVVASGLSAPGGIHAIDTRQNAVTRLFPAPGARERRDTNTYASCRGLPPAAAFRAHGLALRSGPTGVHTLYVIHHGERESVEVFELDGRATPPALTWVGCVIAPESVMGNSVVPLPDGGFAVTNFRRRNDPQAEKNGRTGGITGELWEWQPRTGWARVPGSDAASPNGVEISKDGRWYYIAEWGAQALVRLSRGLTPPQRDTATLGFNVDNLRWAPDGSLLVAGQGPTGQVAIDECMMQKKNCSAVYTRVVKVDPDTLKARQILHYPANSVWTAASVALQVGKEIWLGTYDGDRIARLPLK